MLAYQRRAAVLDALVQAGSLTVSFAARQFGVSEVTVRNDLAILERQGKLRRVHGGAVLATFEARGGAIAEEPVGLGHCMVAERAAAMVEDGEAIVITAGRLGMLLAQTLVARRHLKVVTNSLGVAQLLAREGTNTVIIAGGVVMSSGAVHIDAVTHQSLGLLKATRAFVTTSNLSATSGVMEESLDRAATLRTLIGLADALVVLLDGDGGAGQALVSVVSPRDIDHVVLEEHAPSYLVDALRLSGVTVSLCGDTVTTVPPCTKSQKIYKIAFANLSETEVFTVEVRRSIEAAARRAGNIELLLADNRYDGETALRNAEQFIAQRADLVLEYQVDEGYAYRLMHRLRLARIPVVAIDIPHPGAMYFGVDNYVAGHLAGGAIAREAAQRWSGKLDRLFSLALPRSGPTVAARLQGQIDAIRESTSLADEDIVWLDSQNTYQTAFQRLRDALATITPGTRLALMAVNDETMLGAIAALEELGHARNAIAVSMGADRLALTELQRPGTPLIGAVTFSPETYGERLIAIAQDILAGKDVPPALYQQHRIIRSADVQAYLDAVRTQESDRNASQAHDVAASLIVSGG
jgi:ribose transport system substrate-binding protein